MLSADQLTLVASDALHVSDVVFYLDLVDHFNHYENQDLSVHSKIHTFHHLLYSASEVVFAPNGLWFLCASWTEFNSTVDANSSDANSTRKATCSQNLYFNAGFMLQSRQIEDINSTRKA